MGTLSRKQLHCQCLELLRLKLCLSCNECHPGRAPQLVRKPVVKHEASSNSKHRIYHHHQRSLPSPKRRDPGATPTNHLPPKPLPSLHVRLGGTSLLCDNTHEKVWHSMTQSSGTSSRCSSRNSQRKRRMIQQQSWHR